MKVPFLASLIIFILVLSRAIKKSNHAMKQEEQSFWSREREANSVRKKSLDGLSYITIPFDKLPCDSYTQEADIAEIIASLHVLSERKIVNLTGITNTDLKLTYGTANITVLTEYDQNFTMLVTTLQKWADALYQRGAIADAKTILEYAVSVDSDVSTTYELLAGIYRSENNESGLDNLIKHAEGLNSASGKMILRKLQK